MSHNHRSLGSSGVLHFLWTAGLMAFLFSTASPEALHGMQSATGPTPDLVLLEEQPDAPLVAVTVRFPVGHAADPRGAEGTAHLMGRVIRDQGSLQLDEMGARIDARVDVEEFTVTILAPPNQWDRAWTRARALLVDSRLPAEAVAAARAGQRDRVVFETGAPVRVFEEERAHLLLGRGSPGSRPPLGTAESLDRIEAADLEAFRRDHLDWSGASLAVVGPLSSRQVEAVVGRARLGILTMSESSTRTDALRAPTATAPLRPATGSAAQMAWTSQNRHVVDRNVTSSWITVAWPLPSTTSPVLQSFLAHLLAEELNPVPADRALYRSEVELRQIDGRPVLVVNTTVAPAATLQWEARILAAMDEMGAAPPDGSFFALTRRRYRADLLLREAAPEERALALARALALEGGVPADPGRQIWALDREGVSALARAAGDPRILVFGPAAMMQP